MATISLLRCDVCSQAEPKAEGILRATVHADTDDEADVHAFDLCLSCRVGLFDYLSGKRKLARTRAPK